MYFILMNHARGLLYDKSFYVFSLISVRNGHFTNRLFCINGRTYTPTALNVANTMGNLLGGNVANS